MMLNPSLALTWAVVMLLAGCAHQGVFDEYRETVKANAAAAHESQQQAAKSIYRDTTYDVVGGLEAPKTEQAPKVYSGTGVFVHKPRATVTPQEEGDITLNFENADVREVVKVILGDMLGKNYIIDPQVRGSVTVQTSQPLTRATLLPTLETLLRMNGAAIVESDGEYQVLPAAKAVRGTVVPQLGGSVKSLPPGYGVRIVPLQYVAVQEMQKILEPLAPEGSIIRADTARNLLVLAGSQQELGQLMSTVTMFDVNWLAGMSMGLFPIQSVDVKTVYDELQQVFGGTAEGPLAGIVRLVPVERMNAMLVVTQQPKYLDQAKHWIERLDQGGDQAGRRLYVYYVQNGKAADLAQVLSQVFGAEGRSARPAAPRLAPGMKPAELKSKPGKAGSKTKTAAAHATPASASDITLSTGSEPARIIADESNNALVVLATPADYSKIEMAIRKLDQVPRQVLIEATIAEVTLSGSLQYGLQWFFKNRGIGNKYGGIGSLNLPTDVLPDDVLGGGNFNYALTGGAGEVLALLDVLAGQSKVKILSSPHLMVIDNQTAEIKVGDQVPVRTGSTVTEGGVTTESIQYKDTGVLLGVTPRVNAGGLVTMDVNQEVTDLGDVEPTTQQRRFLQRTITSSVAVQTGETLVLGGLITENRNVSENGVPGLYHLPVVGPLFGSTTDDTKRTELLVLITPRVVRDQEEARRVTEELRGKLLGIGRMPEAGTTSAGPTRLR